MPATTNDSLWKRIQRYTRPNDKDETGSWSASIANSHLPDVAALKLRIFFCFINGGGLVRIFTAAVFRQEQEPVCATADDSRHRVAWGTKTRYRHSQFSAALSAGRAAGKGRTADSAAENSEAVAVTIGRRNCDSRYVRRL